MKKGFARRGRKLAVTAIVLASALGWASDSCAGKKSVHKAQSRTVSERLEAEPARDEKPLEMPPATGVQEGAAAPLVFEAAPPRPATGNAGGPFPARDDRPSETGQPAGAEQKARAVSNDAHGRRERGGAAPNASSPVLKKILQARPAAARTTAAEPRKEPAETAVLNFTDASLKDIIQTVSEITGENFIVSPGVNAKVSVKTVRPVPRSEVFGIFETLLDLNGLSAVRTGSYYKIVAAQSAKQHNIGLARAESTGGLPEGDALLNLLVPVEYVSANELGPLLRPMLSQSGGLTAVPRTNTLFLTDTASNLKKVIEVIEALDNNAFKSLKIELVPVARVDALTLSAELNELFTTLGFVKDSARLLVLPLERLNSLIVIASSQGILDDAKGWIEKLDQLPISEGTSIHTYYVQNDSASVLKTLLEQLYGSGKRPPVGQPAAGAKPPQAKAPLAETGPEEIKIYIHEPSNALIIRSSQRDYMSMLNTIKELDRPPKQALIDALIVEVTLDESLKYGVQWSAIKGNLNIQQNTNIVSSKLDSPRGPISAPIGAAASSGLTAFLTDSSNYFGLLQALASEGKVKVLSNPHIVVKNYEKASINIGSDEPVATQSAQTAVTGTSGIIQNIEYRKTGVILTVTTQITEGGMVALTVRQEVSNKSTDRTVGNAVYPSFSKREAETSVVSRNGQTVVIGGLIEEKKDVSASGVPLLKDIPLLGNLFKFTNSSGSRTELVLLLTARVIKGPDDAAELTEAFKKRIGQVLETINNGVK